MENLDDHMAGHEPFVSELIRTEGFKGLTLRFTTLRPPLNPFKIYETPLQCSARFMLSYTHHQDVGEASGSHISSLDDNGSFSYPTSVDAGPHTTAVCDHQILMSKEKFRLHKAEAHAIKPRDKEKEAKGAKQAKKFKDVNSKGKRRIRRPRKLVGSRKTLRSPGDPRQARGYVT